MNVEIVEITAAELDLYASVPISFTVERVLRLEDRDGGFGGLAFVEESVDAPYRKDYDAEDEGGPAKWEYTSGRRAYFLAKDGERVLGAAAVVMDDPALHMLEGRRDLAVLWDIRVHPDARGRGIGTSLFRRAADWARERGCRQLKIETQNVNVPACRFYAAQGCELGAIHRHGYAANPAVAHEVMLLWFLSL